MYIRLKAHMYYNGVSEPCVMCYVLCNTTTYCYVIVFASLLLLFYFPLFPSIEKKSHGTSIVLY